MSIDLASRPTCRATALLAAFGLAGCGGGGATVSGDVASEPLVLSVRADVSTAWAGRSLGRVEVRVVDASGALCSDMAPSIRLTLVAGDAIAGTTVATATAGVARFDDVRIEEPGTFRIEASAAGFTAGRSGPIEVRPDDPRVIVFVADGWGYKQVEAAARYSGATPAWHGWDHHAVATWDVDTRNINRGVGYDPIKAWTDFTYPTRVATDSASSATAMFCGQKTDSGNIAVAPGDTGRLATIAELAKARGIRTGAVTSVPISHATPAAWIAHNDHRGNAHAIADEMLFGHPNTTGTTATDVTYGGGWGPTAPGLDLLLGAGHPTWAGQVWVNQSMLERLRAEAGQPGAWTLVERVAGSPDAAERLLAAARAPATARLLGLFGGAAANLDFAHADGSRRNRENPTLADMTRAALAMLGARPGGFVLMVEGGAVDWAGHANHLDPLVGEMLDFQAAVATAVAWVEDPSNASDWDNTLIVVTGDHECGFLTAAPGVFPDVPLGEVSARTLALEKVEVRTGRRASWDDHDLNGEIDKDEAVHWAWHTGGHSNSLIPLWAKGLRAERFAARRIGTDPVRGRYVDNTAVFAVMRAALLER